LPKIDKPNAIAFGWQRLATGYPYTYHMFRVRQDQVRWPDGRVGSYAYVEGNGAVWVVPVTADGHVVLIRQFRYTLDYWMQLTK
jgi:ADP-ribose pyrophosphatase